MTVSKGPVPRRASRPRWLDVRVIGGVVLLLASIVVGAKVIGASSHTIGVWAAGHDLAAGTVLVDGDLTSVDVNLGDAAAGYLAASASPVGRMLARAVSSGELLPSAALTDAGSGRVVVIGVSPERMPPGVVHGAVIDLYLTAGSGIGDAAGTTTDLIKSGVTVQSVAAPASGGLSGATSTRYQVAVLLKAADADLLVRTLPKGEPTLVLVTGRPG